MQLNFGYVDGGALRFGYTGAYTGDALLPYLFNSHGGAHPNSIMAEANFDTTGNVGIGVVSDFDPSKVVFDWQAISDDQLWREDVNTLDAVEVTSDVDTTATATLRYRVEDTGSEGEFTVTLNIKAISATATVTITYVPAPGRQVVTLTSWAGDIAFTGSPVAGDQIEGPDTLTINVDGSVSGPDGNYTLRHIDADTGTIEAVSYFIGKLFTLSESATVVDGVTLEALSAPELATTTVTYAPAATMTVVTLVEPVEPYVFQNWASPPVAGEQLLSRTSEGVFDVNGNWSGDAEGVFDFWFIDLSGQMQKRVIDTTGLNEIEDSPSFSLAEGATLGTSAELIKSVNFSVAAVAQAITDIGLSASEIKTLGIQEGATARTNVMILPLNYITPVITLPATDLNAGHEENYNTPEVQLYQASWHKLIAPIHIGGEDVVNISRARMQLFRGTEAVLTLTLNDRISFENSTLYIELDETDTVDLIQGYQYELWVMDLNANPLFVRSGKITFQPTKLRF